MMVISIIPNYRSSSSSSSILPLAALCFLTAIAASAGNTADKQCFFIHGAGQRQMGAPTPTFDAYWGSKIANYTPQCATRTFNHADTVTLGWNNDVLQQAVCDVVAGGHDGRTIPPNTVVFTHSMGNAILAGALHNQHCRLDVETSSWYAVAAEWDGSKAAQFVVHLCSKPKHKWQKWERALASHMNYCNSTTQTAHAAYVSLVPSNPELVNVRTTAEAYVSGGMCGTSPKGLLSTWAPKMEAMSLAVRYGEPDDGLVGVSSCMLRSHNYTKDDHTQQFYSPRVNHMDATCRNGNGRIGKSRKPCSFYSNKV